MRRKMRAGGAQQSIPICFDDTFELIRIVRGFLRAAKDANLGVPVSEHVNLYPHPDHRDRNQHRIRSVAAQGVVDLRRFELIEQIEQCVGGHVGHLFLETVIVEQVERLTRLFDAIARITLNLVERRIQILPWELAQH